jgi:hypothetical protein
MVRKLPAFLLFILLAGASAAHAQPAEKDDRTVERAEKIVSQPARDVGIGNETIPPILQWAVSAPYAPAKGRCAAIVSELKDLNAALGPDFDALGKGDDKATQLAEAGGAMLVNSLIPFRGVVREVSGAAAKDRRMLAAVNAGIARRGYLRGLAAARGCKMPKRQG